MHEACRQSLYDMFKIVFCSVFERLFHIFVAQLGLLELEYNCSTCSVWNTRVNETARISLMRLSAFAPLIANW